MAPHRDAFETTTARMGIFDDVFGARATRGRNERDDSDERVVALRVLVQVSRGDRGSGARATTERDDGARDDDGKRRRPSHDDDDGRASSSEEDEEEDVRAVAAVGKSLDDASTGDDGDDDSDSDGKAPKATPRGSGYRDRDDAAEADALARTVFVGNVPAAPSRKS